MTIQDMNQQDELEPSGSSPRIDLEPGQTGIGGRLREVRGALSLEDFAPPLGVGKSSIARYEAGQRIPDADFLTAVCKEHGVSASWLLLGHGPMREEEVKEAGYLPQGIDRRTAALLGVLDALDQEQRDTILSDCLSRAQTAQQMTKLHQAIHDLEARLGKAS